ncbi:MAG: DEAD/DEAH box helicase [Candidatus Wildermuthbacteria bacterium]|nr:DEAD/DEAH box helicase [Candidatus Wildermuthbacteria bacterium]
MEEQKSEHSGFYGLGIAPVILDILGKLKFTMPTPIQAQAIPSAIQGKDVVGIAQTGTGKTLAFGIPMIQLLAKSGKRGLVVLPTRELALQVEEALRRIGGSMGMRTVVLIGGASFVPQKRDLMRRPHVIIATPGRLLDHLNQRNVSLSDIGIAVLDEADRMLDMGFLPQIQKILHALHNERQTMLFSATMPHEIMKIAAGYMKLPVRIEVAPAGTTADRVAQEVFIVPREQKLALLLKLLEQYKGSALVFSRTKYGAEKIMRQIRAGGISAAELHSNRSLSQRREALEGFKRGTYRVLVATDIASRGIDVAGIETVINFDLPATSEDYVHRIGRTARAGAEGRAVTFATPQEQRDIRGIERMIRKSIPVSRLPELPRVAPAAFVPEEPRRQERRPYGRQGGFVRTGSASRGRRPFQRTARWK